METNYCTILSTTFPEHYNSVRCFIIIIEELRDGWRVGWKGQRSEVRSRNSGIIDERGQVLRQEAANAFVHKMLRIAILNRIVM